MSIFSMDSGKMCVFRAILRQRNSLSTKTLGLGWGKGNLFNRVEGFFAPY